MLAGADPWLECYSRAASEFIVSEKGYEDFISTHTGLRSTLQLLKNLSFYYGEEVFAFLNDVRQRRVGTDQVVDVVRSELFYLKTLSRTVLENLNSTAAVERNFEALYEQVLELLLTVDIKIQLVDLCADVREGCAQVLGCLSLYKLDSICNKYRGFVFERMNDDASQERRRQELLWHIEAIRYVKFNMSNEDNLQKSVAALKVLNPMVYKATHRKSQVHHCMCQSLVSALAPIVRGNWYESKSMRQLNGWFAVVITMRDIIGPWVKSRTKHYVDGFPLFTQLTCLLPKSDFDREYLPLMDTLKGLIQQRTYKQVSIQCIKLLLFCYVKRNQGNIAEVEQLDSLVIMAKKGQLGKECLEDLMNICADTLSYGGQGVWKQWQELLNSDNMQLVLVVVKALTYITLEAPSQLKNPAHSEIIQKLGGDISGCTTLDLLKANIHPLEVYSGLNNMLQPMNQSFEYIWKKVDGHYGGQEKDKICQEVLKHLLRLFPYISPLTWLNGGACSVLPKYYFCQLAQIQEQALVALKRFLHAQPKFRSQLLAGICEFLFTLSMEDTKGIIRGLELVLITITEWHQCICHSSQEAANKDVISVQAMDKMEGWCLLCLCNPEVRIRGLAVEALHSLKCLYLEVNGDIFKGYLEDEEERLFFIDLMEEEGEGKAASVFSDFGNRGEVQSEFMDVHEIKFSNVLLEEGNSSVNGAVRWSRLLNELGRQASLLDLNACTIASSQAYNKLALITTSSLQSADVKDNSYKFKLWRNLLMFISATVRQGDQESFKFFSGIFDQLQSVSDSLISEVLQSAIGHCNRECHEQICAQMQLFLENSQTGGGERRANRKLREESRLQTANVVRLMCGHLDLRNVPPSVVIFLNSWLSELWSIFEHYYDVSVEAHQLKYCLCCVVKQVSKHQSIIQGDLRVGLFQMIKCWGNLDEKEILLPPGEEGSSGGRRARVEGGHRRSLTTEIELYDPEVQVVALQAVAALLSCPIKDLPMLRSEGMMWINSMLEGDEEQLVLAERNMSGPTRASLGMEGLKNLMHANIGLFDETLDNCYKRSAAISRGYFKVLTDVYCFGIVKVDMPRILSIVLYKLCDPDQQVRDAALQLVKALSSTILDTLDVIAAEVGEVSAFVTTVLGGTLDPYIRLQQNLATKLAKVNEYLCWEVCSEALRHLKSPVAQVVQQQVLQCLCPWLQQISLDKDCKSNKTAELLQDMFNTTQDMLSQFQDELEMVWQSIVQRDSNFSVVVDFIMYRGIEALNIQLDNTSYAQQYFMVSKQIILYTSKVQQLQSQAVEFFIKRILKLKDWQDEGWSGRNLSTVYERLEISYIGSETSTAHQAILALIFLSEVSREEDDTLRQNAGLLMHACMLCMDADIHTLPQHCIQLLLNLLYTLVAKQLSLHASTGKYDRVLMLMSQLQDQVTVGQDKQAWHESQLREIVGWCVEAFSSTRPNFRSDWLAEALQWIAASHSYQIVCRSLWIYRALSPPLSNASIQILLNGILQCVQVFSQHTHQSQNTLAAIVCFEILQTLKTIIVDDTSANILIFPQLFWAIVSLLNLNVQKLQSHILEIFELLVSKLKLSSSSIQNVLLSSAPKIQSEANSAMGWQLGERLLGSEQLWDAELVVTLQQVLIRGVGNEEFQEGVVNLLESLTWHIIEPSSRSGSLRKGVMPQTPRKFSDNAQGLSLMFGELEAQLLVSILMVIPFTIKTQKPSFRKKISQFFTTLAQFASIVEHHQLADLLKGKSSQFQTDQIISFIAKIFCPKYLQVMIYIALVQLQLMPKQVHIVIIQLLIVIAEIVGDQGMDSKSWGIMERILKILFNLHADNPEVNQKVTELVGLVQNKIVPQQNSDRIVSEQQGILLESRSSQFVLKGLKSVLYDWERDSSGVGEGNSFSFLQLDMQG